jgi:hypothetical protein
MKGGMYMTRFIRFILIISLLTLAACTSDSSSNAQTTSIESLNIGDRVVDLEWSWEYRQGWGYTKYSDTEVTEPVVWIVVAKNHDQANSVTLISEGLIGFFVFDASTLPSGLQAGQNHWGNSGLNATAGLRPWLNSTSPHAGEGFLSAFSADFKSILLSSTVENKEYDTGAIYTTNDYVYVPSHTEMGATDHSDTYSIGKPFEYFVGADYTKLRAKMPGTPWTYDYWTRSPYVTGYRVVGQIIDSGYYVNDFADDTSNGVRVVVNVKSDTKVAKEPNEDGVFVIKYK